MIFFFEKKLLYRLIASKTPGRILPVFPTTVAADIAFNAMNIATCTLSNVPGPQEQCHLASVPLTNMEFYLFSGVGLYFGLFSYNGQVSATVNMDKKIGADPQNLVDLFIPAFEEIFQSTCGTSSAV